MAEENFIFFVRTAAAHDVPAIINLVKASWAGTYDPVIGVEARKAKSDAKHVPDLFLGEIARRDAISLIALDKTDIIGHIGGEMRGAETFFAQTAACLSARHSAACDG